MRLRRVCTAYSQGEYGLRRQQGHCALMCCHDFLYMHVHEKFRSW